MTNIQPTKIDTFDYHCVCGGELIINYNHYIDTQIGNTFPHSFIWDGKSYKCRKCGKIYEVTF